MKCGSKTANRKKRAMIMPKTGWIAQGKFLVEKK